MITNPWMQHPCKFKKTRTVNVEVFAEICSTFQKQNIGFVFQQINHI
jgi:hypothetical protein